MRSSYPRRFAQRHVRRNVGGVVVLASPPRDPIRSNTASGDASERCTRAAPRRLLLPRSSKYGGDTDWIYNATTRCKWWRVSAAGLRLHAVGRERERRAAGRLGFGGGVYGRGRPIPLYIEGGAASPCPSSKPWAGGQGREEWGARTLPSSRNPISSLNDFKPYRIGWALWGLVPLAQCGQDTPS